jgi:hypothetical protein
MSTGPTRSYTLPRRTGQLSLLTLALLASGACSLPVLAAEPARAITRYARHHGAAAGLPLPQVCRLTCCRFVNSANRR